MKNILLLGTIIFFVAAIGVAIILVRQNQEYRKGAAPSTDLTLFPSVSSVALNDTFTVDVGVNSNGNQLAGAEMYVSYDTSKIEFVSGTPGTFFANPTTIGPTATNGQIFYTIALPPDGEPIDGQGTVAKLTFKAIAAGSATFNFVRPDTIVVAIREGGQNVLQNATGTTITVTSATSATPTPTATATATGVSNPNVDLFPTATATATSTASSTAVATATATSVSLSATATARPSSTSTASATPKLPSELPDTGVETPVLFGMALAGSVFLISSGLFLASKKS